MTEEEAREKFAALVVPYTQGDLASASERTKEAAKHWKKGTRAPNSSSLITLARRIPRIRDWVMAEIDTPAVAQADGPDAMAAVLTGLQLAANLPGQQGAIARALLKQMTGGG